jgi:hypothetical protein
MWTRHATSTSTDDNAATSDAQDHTATTTDAAAVTASAMPLPAMADQFVTQFVRGSRRLSWQWAGPDIPRVKPPVRALFVKDDGRIWAQLSQVARFDASSSISRINSRWSEQVVFDVFEPSGQYVGQVAFPAPTGNFVAKGDTV